MMQAAHLMQQFVEDLLRRHWHESDADRIYMVLVLADYGHLIVEEWAYDHFVRVGFYLQDARGGLLPDPAILFCIQENEGWVPVEYTRILGGHQVIAAIQPDEGTLHTRDHRHQAALAAYANVWAYNLRCQGWIERAQRVHDPQLQEESRHGGEAAPPDLDTLLAWLEKGGCEATDGCWVEPDGVCPHGHPSWFLRIGLIRMS